MMLKSDKRNEKKNSQTCTKTHCSPHTDINHKLGCLLKRIFYPPFTPTNLRFFLAPLFPCLSATPFFFIMDLRPAEEEDSGREEDENRNGRVGKKIIRLLWNLRVNVFVLCLCVCMHDAWKFIFCVVFSFSYI